MTAFKTLAACVLCSVGLHEWTESAPRVCRTCGKWRG
jgi:hypothetical protein